MSNTGILKRSRILHKISHLQTISSYVKATAKVYSAHCAGEHIPEIGDASLIGSGDTVGDCVKSDINISVSGDTAGEGVRAPSSSKATGFFLCFVFFRFPFFFSIM